MDPVSLRPGDSGDLDFVYELRRSGFEPYTEALFGPWNEVEQRMLVAIEFEAMPFEIALQGGARVGYLAVVMRADHVWLDEIAVVAPSRDRGLGTFLVGLVIARARAAHQPVRLSVLVNNPSRRLYERLGFVVTDVEHPRVTMQLRVTTRG